MKDCVVVSNEDRVLPLIIRVARLYIIIVNCIGGTREVNDCGYIEGAPTLYVFYVAMDCSIQKMTQLDVVYKITPL